MKNSNGSIIVIVGENDDSDNLVRILSDVGYNVERVSLTGINISPEEIPDCFIISCGDYYKSLKICSCIKSDIRLCDIPVILINGGNDSSDVVKAFDAGAADYIIMPYPEKELLARVNNHVSMQMMNKRLEYLVLERTAELTNINRILQVTVDEHRKILKDLQENETLLLTIALNIPNSYLAILEKNYTIGFASGQEFKKSGVDAWRLLGLPVEKVYGEKFPEVKKYYDRTFSGEEVSFEFFMNSQYQYYRTVPIMNSNGDISRILVVAENITERKENEIRIQESLHEKETLLREIHHRVKNNLQIVSSLLNIQAHSSKSPELIDILKSIQGRIYSMALVHEKLYHYKNFSRINFREYLVDLTDEIRSLFSEACRSCNIEVSMDLADESLSIEKAIPCGLIMNELIINAYKHAFRESGGGVINIAFRKKSAKSFSMTVSDNGKGLPEDFSLAATDSMGMIIVRELASQLNGKVFISNTNGTCVEIIFGNESAGLSRGRGAVAGSNGRNILIVEDERIIAKMLRRIIEDEGYNIVECVSSGKDAIYYALEKKPDLVIMDILLEDEIDGIEAARRICAEHDCRIIFLTGNSDANTISSALDVKPYRILTKPVQRYQLVEVIHSALGKE